MTPLSIRAIGTQHSRLLTDVVFLVYKDPEDGPTLTALRAALRGTQYDERCSKHYAPRALWLAVRGQRIAGGFELVEGEVAGEMVAGRWWRGDAGRHVDQGASGDSEAYNN